MIISIDGSSVGPPDSITGPGDCFVLKNFVQFVDVVWRKNCKVFLAMHRLRGQCFVALSCSFQRRRVLVDGAAGTVSGECPCHLVRSQFLQDFSELPSFVCGDPGCFGMCGSCTCSFCCLRRFRFCHIVFTGVTTTSSVIISGVDSVTTLSLSDSSSPESLRSGTSLSDALSSGVFATVCICCTALIPHWIASMVSDEISAKVLLTTST